MTRIDYDLTILGGGSGGLTAARLAAALGARVLLIDKERLGGDCLYSGCVPSKSLIQAARIVHQTREAARFGLTPHALEVDMTRVAASIQEVIARVQEAEQVYTRDVTVKFGRVAFQSPTTLLLDTTLISSRAIVIATGSRPAQPSIEGLAEVDYMTNEDIFQLNSLPASLVIVGGGPVGVELGQALTRLGVQVTLLQRSARILPREDPDLSAAIAQVLAEEGLKLLTEVQVVKVTQVGSLKQVVVQQGANQTTIEAEAILLATGRQPNLETLNLEATGVAFTAQGITVNDYLQTSTPHIFALGDVIGGGPRFTHVAAYQAGVAVRNALLPIGKTKVDYRVLPWCTFTDPEAARVGLTFTEAQKQQRHVRTVTLPWSEIDRAQTERAPTGWLKLVLAGRKEQIVGAHLVGSHAGELLGEIALAMRHRLSIADLLATIHAYPTLHTGLQQTAFEAYLSSATAQSNRSIVSLALRLRR